MDEKAALLNQLRIERPDEIIVPRKRWLWLAALLVLVLAAVASAFWLRSPAIPVHIAVAQSVSPTAGGDGPTGSVLDASGYVVARRQATVASKITAKMIELNIEEGDHVEAGQTIAKLDDTNIRAALEQAASQLAYARSSLAETQVNLANAQRDYDRNKSLIQQHFVSQSAMDNSQTTLDALRAQLATQRGNVDVVARALNVAERNLDDTIVRAPFSGVVTVKAAQPGEMVSPISAGGGFTRTGIGTIVDMDSLEFQVDVNENFINRVHPGQAATAKLNAYPDWQIPAHVIAIIPTADRSKGTVMVRIAIDKGDSRILPEMGVRVSFLASAVTDTAAPAAGVTVPAAAVQESGNSGTVFIVHDGTVERRAVRLGANNGSSVTVVAGLTAGTRVAIGDLTQLKDGAKIRVEQ